MSSSAASPKRSAHSFDGVVDGAEDVGHGGLAGRIRDQYQEAALAGG